MKVLIVALLLALSLALVWVLENYDDASLLTVYSLAGAAIGTHILYRRCWR